jgi:muramoyltetrapeptide carboxypeptidase
MTTLVRPRALRPGDLVGICAPAGAVEQASVERGADALRALGFEVRLSPSVLARHAFTAGRAAERLADLQALFADEGVRAIVCARGGAGSAWLLPGLDAALVRRHPKVFVGYSDATFLHLFLNAQGLVTFHGPMAARELAAGAYEPDSFWSAVTGAGAFYATAPGDLASLRPGTAEGRLRGGCLSILAAAAGTPWAFRADAEGSILFLEDVDERPYRVDRMLFQLRASGALEGVRGIVFGEMKGCAAGAGDAFTLEEVLLEALHGLDLPVAFGLSSGHTDRPAVTLPLGVRARLDCRDTADFRILEAGVS